jgi:hypothetical protein
MLDKTIIDTSDLVGRTISEIKVNGYGIHIKFTDGVIFDYDASDGGYSQWDTAKDK